MRNKQSIYFFALTLSILFSLIYLLVFTFYIPSQEEKITYVYMNQIGLYKEKSNADKELTQLKTSGLEGYIYIKDGLYVVVSGISEKEKESEKNGEELKRLSFSYILKKVTIKDQKMSEMVKQKKYQEVLEMIADKS